MILVKAKGAVDRLSNMRESIIRAIWLKPLACGALLEVDRDMEVRIKLLCQSLLGTVDPHSSRNAFVLSIPSFPRD